MTLQECPPGFFLFEDCLCFKTEYKTSDGWLEVYNEGGEAFWGGQTKKYGVKKLIVQPVTTKWIEKE